MLDATAIAQRHVLPVTDDAPAAIGATLRRAFSRGAWSARLLRLPPAALPGDATGLLMVQVDGLSRRQLDRALAAGEMPFLRSLLDGDSHRLHDLYSGVPSTTPAVQGELFYGIRTAVPAFGYIASETGEVVRMLESESAARVQSRLAAMGGGLLEGGAAYADIFDGGASSAHFCSSRLRWENAVRWRNLAGACVIIAMNLFSLVHAMLLLLIELALAIVDCLRGIVGGRNLLQEVAFVPSRVAVCVLLREFVRIGAEMDLARGLRVIHLNFLGYDEQSHRRGPSSAFAHWSLRGIDASIRRLHGAAVRSPMRRYQLVVYSDHGQEESIPYEKLHGRTIEAAVAAVIVAGAHGDGHAAGRSHGEQRARARWLFGERSVNWVSRLFGAKGESDGRRVRVVAMGPVGFVYLPWRLSIEERERLGRALVDAAQVPLVLARDDGDRVWTWSAAGRFELPRDARAVFGEWHPYLAEVGEDMAALCRHRDAGQFVLCGFRVYGPPVTFPIENGSHGGPGYEETHAFALLPATRSDTQLPGSRRDACGEPYLRPLDLRRAATQLLEARP